MRNSAPAFFHMCVPGLSEQYKMAVYFNTNQRDVKKFGLRLFIVTEEASLNLIDQFNTVSNHIFSQLDLEMTIDRIAALEQNMFLK